MNKKILSRVFFLLSLVFIIPLGVSAAGRDAQDAEPVDMETLLAGIPSDAYGGVYINENGQIVVNIVNGKEIAYAQNMTLDDSQNVIYNHVDISMESLEVVHDALIPYMNQYGIVTIDANEVTNSLDIEVYARNEDLVDFLQNYIDLKHVNITVLPEGHTIQASVATEPPTTNFYEEYTNNNARLGSPLYPGACIRIGTGNSYCTAGPRISLMQFCTCGHILNNFFNRVQDVYAREWTAGVATWSKIGTTGRYIFGSSGDSSVVSVTGLHLPTTNTLLLNQGTYSYAMPVVGYDVQMFGAYSGMTSGKILATDVTVNIGGVAVSNLACASYPCIVGDSGAGIFSDGAMYASTSYCYGIQSCRSVDENGNWVASYFHQFD